MAILPLLSQIFARKYELAIVPSWVIRPIVTFARLPHWALELQCRSTRPPSCLGFHPYPSLSFARELEMDADSRHRFSYEVNGLLFLLQFPRKAFRSKLPRADVEGLYFQHSSSNYQSHPLNKPSVRLSFQSTNAPHENGSR